MKLSLRNAKAFRILAIVCILTGGLPLALYGSSRIGAFFVFIGSIALVASTFIRTETSD